MTLAPKFFSRRDSARKDPLFRVEMNNRGYFLTILKRKGGKQMRRGILLGLVLGLMVLGSAMESSAQGGPVLEGVWAPSQINWGQELHVYVKAKAGDSDMRWIWVSGGKQAAGQGGSVPIRLNANSRKELNGYVYWDTHQARQRDVTGTVTIQIEDWKGNESASKSVTIHMVPKGAKVEKPPAEFKNVAIGPVMISPYQGP
jgi:hypothetical protein